MSGLAPWWKRQLIRLCPWLFWTCPAKNKHWAWDRRVCYCRLNEHMLRHWHGGVLVDGQEFIPYEQYEEVLLKYIQQVAPDYPGVGANKKWQAIDSVLSGL